MRRPLFAIDYYCLIRRRRNFGLALAGLVVGHGVTIGGYLYMDRVDIPGTSMQVSVCRAPPTVNAVKCMSAHTVE